MEKSKEVSGGAPIPHVIVLPYPSQGHINPLLQFAKRLAAKGVRATIAATATTASSIHAAAVAVEQISDGRGSAKAGGEEEYLTSLREHGSKSLAQLLDRYRSEGFPVDCVIYDAFFPWALDVAHRHGAAGAAFFTNSAAVCAIFSHIHGGTLELPVDVDGDGPLILPGLPPLNSCDVPTFIRNPQSYPAYLAMKLSQFSNLAMADFVFANTFQALEGQVLSLSLNFPAIFSNYFPR